MTLEIPSVTVDGEQFAVNLEMVDPVSQRLRLSALGPATADAEAVIFDSVSGQVQIPNAALVFPDGSMEHYELRLEYLPDSDPPIFNVLNLTPLEE